MKIVTTTTTETEYGYEEETNFEVALTTENYRGSISLGNGEPEDMTLTRDLSGAFDIPDMLKAAYEAGKNGEEFIFEETTE